MNANPMTLSGLRTVPLKPGLLSEGWLLAWRPNLGRIRLTNWDKSFGARKLGKDVSILFPKEYNVTIFKLSYLYNRVFQLLYIL